MRTGKLNLMMNSILSSMRGALGLALAGTLVALSVAQPASAAESLDRTRDGSEMRAAAPKGAARYWRSIARVSGRLAPLYRTPGIESVDIKTRGPRGFGSAVVTLKGGVDRPSLKSLQNTLAADDIRLERIPRYTAQTINDPNYVDGQQWDIKPYNRSSNPAGMSVEAAWGISTGEGAVVAVLDTGFLPGHPDFVGLDVAPGYDFVTYYDNDATAGRDADPSDPGDGADEEDPDHAAAIAECGPEDGSGWRSSWHGTHVAGTIAAQANGTGIAGIAPDVTLLPVRVLGQCGGTDEDIADAIRWSAGLEVAGVPLNTNPADVINMSLGGWGPDCEGPDGDAIRDALAVGTITVVAAGNESDDARNYSPSSCIEAVTVAALSPNGGPAPYTNVGPAVDVSAPGGDDQYEPAVTPDADYPGGCPFGLTSLSDYGVPGWVGAASIWCTKWRPYDVSGKILSTISSDLYDFDGNYDQAHYQGTSMAAPHVAAVAALIRAEFPDMSAMAVISIMKSRSSTYLSKGGTNSDFASVSWFTNWLIAWGGVAGVIEVGETFTPSEVRAYNWDAAWGGTLPCDPTPEGSMAYLVMGWDPCVRTKNGQLSGSYWEAVSWSNYGRLNNEDWYFVKGSGACESLGCGSGALNAYLALVEATSVNTKMTITNNSLPSINGSVAARRTLTARNGSWSSGYRISFAYQWYQCTSQVIAGGNTLDGTCTAIGAATRNSYKLGPAVSGKYLLVGITANNGYNTLTRFSASTATPAP
jgi:subtilisin family serine protease